MSQFYLIMDVGGTKSTGALFTKDGELVDGYAHVVQSQTYHGEEAVYQNTRKVLDDVISHFGISADDVIGIGVGAPGPLDQERGVILEAPMMGWKNFPLAERLSKDYGKPTRIDNDGNLGALAEHRCGEGRGFANVMYMTVSTGCGGGIVINNRLYRGRHGGAGEVGHVSIDLMGKACPCGSAGCVEMYASGTALVRQMKADMKDGLKSEVFELAGYQEENLNGRILTQAAAMGDAYALDLYQKEGYYLGVALANYFNLYDPDVIVLGGGVTKARTFFHREMVRVLKERCLQPVEENQIRYSILNDRVVLYGAYCMIHDYVTNRNTTQN